MPLRAPRIMFALLERLILFFVVISTVRSALQFVFRMWRGTGASPTPTPRPNRPADLVSATLHQDPVCGVYIAADTSVKRVVEGKVLHFCSDECRSRFSSS